MEGFELWEDLRDELCALPGVEPSTMMGFPCVRIDGAFFGSWDPRAEQLVVKLPEDRVGALVGDGIGATFAPSGRPFREWVAVARADGELWRNLLEEARRFVSGT